MPSPISLATRRRRWTLPAALLLAIGLAVLATAPADAARHRVEIEQYAYGPASLNVTQGDTVTWINLDSVEHDVVVTSGPESFRSPMLSRGESWSHTFTTPGSYSYICSVHPDMRASVTAAAAPAPPTSAPARPTPTAQAVPSVTTITPTAEQHADPEPATKGSRPRKARSSTTTPTAATPVTAAVPASATATLNPLLLVAGASIAVVVFCLLLMAARPVYPGPGKGPGQDSDEP